MRCNLQSLHQQHLNWAKICGAVAWWSAAVWFTPFFLPFSNEPPSYPPSPPHTSTLHCLELFCQHSKAGVLQFLRRPSVSREAPRYLPFCPVEEWWRGIPACHARRNKIRRVRGIQEEEKSRLAKREVSFAIILSGPLVKCSLTDQTLALGSW